MRILHALSQRLSLTGSGITLEAAINRTLDAAPIVDPARTKPEAPANFGWEAVFVRVEAVWRSLASI